MWFDLSQSKQRSYPSWEEIVIRLFSLFAYQILDCPKGIFRTSFLVTLSWQSMFWYNKAFNACVLVDWFVKTVMCLGFLYVLFWDANLELLILRSINNEMSFILSGFRVFLELFLIHVRLSYFNQNQRIGFRSYPKKKSLETPFIILECWLLEKNLQGWL